MTPRPSNDNDPFCTRGPGVFVAEIIDLTAQWAARRRPPPPPPKPLLRLV